MQSDLERRQRGAQKLGEILGQTPDQVDRSLGDVAPQLATYVLETIYGEIYQSAALDKRTRQIVTVAADREGIFHPAVDRDAHVVKGAKIGSVTDYLNRPLQDVLAPESGIIMFVRALPSLKKGDTIANVGVVSTEPR